MRAVWKWLAIVPVALIALAVSLLFFAERLIDSEYLTQQLRNQAAQAGYTLEIGELKWKLLPQTHLALSELTATAQHDPSQVISLQQVSAYVSIGALLSQKLRINELSLEELHIQQQQQTTLRLQHFRGNGDDINTVGRPFTLSGELNNSPWQATVRYDASGQTHTTVTIHIDQVDLDAIAPAANTAPATQSTAVANTSASAKPQTAADKPQAATEPLGAALAGILAYPGDYALHIDALRARGFDVQQLALAASVSGQTIALHKINLNAYGGQAHHTGQLEVDAEQALHFELDANYSGIDVGAVSLAIDPLNPAAQGGSLSGQARFSSRGRDSEQLTQRLNGQLQLQIDNTQLNNFNLEQTICNAATDTLKMPPLAAQWQPHTVLNQLRFSGKVQQGVLHIQELQGELDSARLSGRGAVDLARQISGLKMDAQLTQAYKQANTCPAINQTLRDIQWPLACEGSYAERAFGETCSVDRDKLQKIATKRLLNKALGDEKSSVIDKLKNLFR